MRSRTGCCLVLASFSSAVLLWQQVSAEATAKLADDDDDDVGLVSRDLYSIQDILWFSKYFGVPEENRPFIPISGGDNGDNFNDFLQNNEIGNGDISFSGNVNKRDYSAGQLLDILRQLARSRGRHRQIRIAGKSLRFGISRK